MNRKNNSDNRCNSTPDDSDDYVSLDVTSYTEMTGAVPRPPLTDAEAESYGDIVSMPQQCADHANKQKSRRNKRNELL